MTGLFIELQRILFPVVSADKIRIATDSTQVQARREAAKVAAESAALSAPSVRLFHHCGGDNATTEDEPPVRPHSNRLRTTTAQDKLAGLLVAHSEQEIAGPFTPDKTP